MKTKLEINRLGRYGIGLLICMICVAGCTKNFEEINTNPDATSTLTPAYMLSLAEYNGAGDIQMLLEGTMQYTTSFNDVAGFGSKYIASQYGQSWTTFDNSYPNEINQINSVIETLKKDSAANVSEIAISEIWRVFCFSKVTDLYGDIPYSEAGKGYDEKNYAPVYDKQSFIYEDMLSRLQTAVAALNKNSVQFATADLLYGGNASQWQKFGRSLMLRLAMRLTKVDVSMAEQWVKEAVKGDLITDDADVAKITDYAATGQNINKNPFAYSIYTSDYLYADGNNNPEGGKFQDVFINHLKDYKDPRLKVLSVVYVNGAPDTSVAIQKGMPATFSSKPQNFVTYSEPAQNTLVKLDGPYQIMGNAEVNFLLAEAALRGWYTGTPVAVLYADGIRAAMRRWAGFGSSSAISSNETEAYVAAHPLSASDDFATNMSKIYTELWVELVTDPVESFASYRRTGYPALVPNNYTGNATGGQIFRRMLYPTTEQNLNTANYNAAIADQGADDFMTRIWWDVEQ